MSKTTEGFFQDEYYHDLPKGRHVFDSREITGGNEWFLVVVKDARGYITETFYEKAKYGSIEFKVPSLSMDERMSRIEKALEKLERPTVAVKEMLAFEDKSNNREIK